MKLFMRYIGEQIQKVPTLPYIKSDRVNRHVTFATDIVVQNVIHNHFIDQIFFYWKWKNISYLSNLERLRVTERVLEEL